MKIAFAGMTTEIPDGWVDDSTLTFSIPPDRELDAPLALRESERPSGNVTITWDRRAGALQPDAYLDAKLNETARTLPRFTVEARQALGDGAERLAVAECSFDPGVPLKQVLVVKRVGAVVVVVTGTAFPGTYPRWRETFVEIARSARLD